MTSVSRSETPVAVRQLSHSHLACCGAGSCVIFAESSCCSCHAASGFFLFLLCTFECRGYSRAASWAWSCTSSVWEYITVEDDTLLA